MEPHTGLNNLDYIVLGVILASGLLALMRGFIREVFSLGAWVGAYFAAARFYPLAKPWVRHYIKHDQASGIVSALTIFCAALIVFSLIGYLIAQLVRGNALTAIDRSLGFIFGLMRGALVVCLLYLGCITILWPDIDKAPNSSNPGIEAQNTENGTVPPDHAARGKDKEANPPPEWLMEARTRPFMDYGAMILKAFLPEKEFEKIEPAFLEQKRDAQHMIDQKALDIMSTPAPLGSNNDATINSGNNQAPAASVPPVPANTPQAPAYDTKSRSGLNNLIDQRAKP